MQGVSYVVERVKAGDRIMFGRDPYGQPFVELWRGWLFQRRAKVELTAEEVRNVKRALLSLH